MNKITLKGWLVLAVFAALFAIFNKFFIGIVVLVLVLTICSVAYRLLAKLFSSKPLDKPTEKQVVEEKPIPLIKWDSIKKPTKKDFKT